MILINLLPHREERRQRRKQAFFIGLGASAIAGAAIVALWYVILQQMITNQDQRNARLTTEIKELESQISDIATLKGDIEALKARQKAVENLQTDRNMPVHMLNELVNQTPEGMYISGIKQDGQTIVVTGVAQTNERVAEFLRNTSNNSPWLERPELVEIKQGARPAGNPATAAKDQKLLFDFSVKLSLKRPGESDGAASAPAAASASAPAGASAAAAASQPARRT